MVVEPLFELDWRVGIVQPRELLRPRKRRVAVVLVHGDSVAHERVVEKIPSIIDPLVEGVGLPLGIGHRERCEPLMDS